MAWLPWPSSKAATPPPLDKSLVSELKAKIASTPTPVLALSVFAVGSITTVTSAIVYRRFFRRFRTGDWVTPDVFARKKWIKGLVTSVGDADNFRLYHTPAFGWRWPIKFRRIPSKAKDLKDQTLHIRMAGVDAPEASHFGRPAQPYAAESLSWLKQQIEGKTVYCQLIRRDQYSRIVAIVQQSPRILPGSFFSGKNLSIEMLRAGWVTIYEQSGAEYGRRGKEEFLRVEAEAKAARRGIWKSGLDAETPAEFKRRYAQSADDAGARKSVEEQRPGKGTGGWLKRLWS